MSYVVIRILSHIFNRYFTIPKSSETFYDGLIAFALGSVPVAYEKAVLLVAGCMLYLILINEATHGVDTPVADPRAAIVNWNGTNAIRIKAVAYKDSGAFGWLTLSNWLLKSTSKSKVAKLLLLLAFLQQVLVMITQAGMQPLGADAVVAVYAATGDTFQYIGEAFVAMTQTSMFTVSTSFLDSKRITMKRWFII